MPQIRVPRASAATLALAVAAGLLLAADPVAAAGSLAERITALRSGHVNWRAQLAAPLSALHGARILSGKTEGVVAAGTITLAATIELSGDTTIVAKDIVVATGTVRVIGNGHELRLYPVNSLGSKGSRQTNIDSSGRPGSNGTDGGWGSHGRWGASGLDGYTATGPDDCNGGAGWPGEPGEFGGDGGHGTNGGNGTDATNITFDVPFGSTESYRFIARGGAGGHGGFGGFGGYGGYGGSGGRGGDSYYGECYFNGGMSFGGPGGNGGYGGFGGWGGNGGNGGKGGRGGNVEVSYAGDYNPANITIENNGGAAGFLGFGGGGGLGGQGGVGGPGGFSWFPPDYAEPGYDGGPGNNGGNGRAGLSGTAGANGEKKLTERCPNQNEPEPSLPPHPDVTPGLDEFTMEFEVCEGDLDSGAAAAGATTMSLFRINCRGKLSDPAGVPIPPDFHTAAVGDGELNCKLAFDGSGAVMKRLGIHMGMWRRKTGSLDPWTFVDSRRASVPRINLVFVEIFDDCQPGGFVWDYITTASITMTPPKGYDPPFSLKFLKSKIGFVDC